MYNLEPTDKNRPELDGEYDTRIVCPLCSCENVHFSNATGIPGDDLDYSQWSGRGGCVCVPMRCEMEHVWEMCVGFHKGYTYIFNKKNA